MQIPSKKLLALLEASEQMMKAISSHHDRKFVLETVVELGRELLNAESCAIFVAESSKKGHGIEPHKLKLEASQSELKIELPEIDEFPIKSEHKAGISAHVAYTKKLLRLNNEQIEKSPYVRNHKVDYLTEEKGFSAIVYPLMDRKGILLGILKVDNKKGTQGPAPTIEFTEVDEEIIRILSKKVAVLLESLRVQKVINNFMQDMLEARTRKRIPRLIIDRAKDLLRADRSELALWNEIDQRLEYVASTEEETKMYNIGDAIPENGFIHRVWEQKEAFRISGNINEETYYVALDSETRSEIALRIEIGEKKIGVINIESFTKNWFDEQDLSILKILAKHAALSVQLNNARTNFQTLAHEVLEDRARGQEEMLHNILDGILESYGFDGGCFYIHEEEHAHLRCLAYMTPKKVPKDIYSFAHKLDTNSLAGYVFNKKIHYFSSDPKNDAKVSKPGLEKFKIEGEILGIPLIFREKAIGVLTIWGVNNPSPLEEDFSRLTPFARLAASKISMSKYERERDGFLKKLADSKALFRSLVNYIPQKVFRKDLDLTFTFANKSFYESLKVDHFTEVLGKKDADFYIEEHAKAFEKDDRKVIREKLTIEKKEKHQPRNEKEPIWVKVVKTPVLDSEGEIIGIQAIFWDITEEKKASDRYKSLVELSPDSIILHKDKRISLANPAAVELLGAENEAEIIGKEILSFIHPDDKESSAQRHALMEQHNHTPEVEEMRIITLEKKEVDVEVYARPSYGEREIQVVFHDLSRIKIILEEMHHRVRKSLNEVNSYLKLQEIKTDLHPDAKTVFKSLSNRIQAMATIHEILSRKSNDSTVPMTEYFDNLKDAIFTSFGANKEDIRCKVNASKLKLEEKQAKACGLIFNELLSNSFRHAFGGGKGTVYLTLEPINNHTKYRFIYRDNGPGIKRKDSYRNKTMGLHLIEWLTEYQLKGKIKKETKNRFECKIEFPI